MHIAAEIAVTNAVELPDERHKGMPGTGQSGSNRVHIEQFQLGFAGDFRGGVGRNHT
jgi:hypothetical protein